MHRVSGQLLMRRVAPVSSQVSSVYTGRSTHPALHAPLRKNHPGAWFEVVGGPLNMKGTGRSISHEMLLTETHANERMRIHCLQGYISTLYLVEYPVRPIEDRWLLLDCGMPNDVQRVHAFMRHMTAYHPPPGSPEPAGETFGLLTGPPVSPKVVVSTHCHIDHFGAADRWLHQGSYVALASEMHAFYSGFRGRLQEIVDTTLSILVARRLGRRFEALPFMSLLCRNSWNHVQRLAQKIHLRNAKHDEPHAASSVLSELDDGSLVPYFEDWVALKCPGHTDHMVLLYHPLTQILYVADFFVAPRKFRFQSPVPVDIDYAYSHSIHRLRQLPVRYALLAHGGVVDMEDVGGWDSVLDAVVEQHTSPASRRTAIRFIDKLTSFAAAPGAYSRDRLPRKPLPISTTPNPPPISYVKNM